jgi:16S rRNA C967 or C1407 C5-methylase (RsmB/RsmF family)
VFHLDAKRAEEMGESFDRILLDMPCSGNFASDKNWFEQRTMTDIKRNAALQRQILSEALKVLKHDGEIVYSTCSLEPEENEINIDWAVKNLGLQVQQVGCYGQKGLTTVFDKDLDVSIQNCKRIWPGLTQGFFIAKLKRADAP